MVREIELSKGYIGLVDDSDYAEVSKHKWYAQTGRKGKKNVYVARRDYRTGKLVKLHRVLLGITDPKVQVDHINGNGLDNRRCNLRLVSNAENARNVSKRPECSTRYKGVCYSKRDELYFAYINFNGKRQYLGYSKDNPEELARIYDQKAKELHGEFAKLNFPEKEAA